MLIKNKKEKSKSAPVIPHTAKEYLYDSFANGLRLNGNFVTMQPESVQEVFPLLQDKCHILSAGVCIGELKGKDLIPAHELALSTALNPEAFPSVELSWEDAIKYLRKEVLLLPEETKKGYVVMRYKGFPLGFVKNLGNRANNLYPQEWRIRTSHLPEKINLYS